MRKKALFVITLFLFLNSCNKEEILENEELFGNNSSIETLSKKPAITQDDFIDINCVNEELYHKIKRSVGLLYSGTSFVGTGSFIRFKNDESEDRLFFITAAHCIMRTDIGHLVNNGYNDYWQNLNETEFVKWKIKLDYESVGCGNTSVEMIKYPPFYMEGLKLRVYSEELEIALFEVYSPNNSQKPVCKIGWTIDEALTESAFCIHHPDEMLRKISFEDDKIYTLEEGDLPDFNTSLYEYEDFWFVNFDKGKVAKGSSGSGLINSSGQLIGCLSNGGIFLSSYSKVAYSKFYKAWFNNNGDRRVSLKYWLADNDANLTYLDYQYLSAAVDLPPTIIDPKPPCEIQLSISESGRSPVLSWNSDDVHVNYKVYRKILDNVSSIRFVLIYDGPNTSFTDDEIRFGQGDHLIYYYVQVECQDAADNTASSNYVTTTGGKITL